MDEREELEMLRAKKAARLAELEAKAGGAPVAAAPQEQGILDTIKQGAGDLLQGGKASLDKTALGLKGLLPQSWQDAGDNLDRAVGSGGLTKATAIKAPDTKMGTLGEIGTDIGLSLAPGAALGKGAALIKSISALGKAAPAVGLGVEMLGNAGINAAMAPEDRGDAAMWGAGGAAAGALGSRLLGGALRKSVSPEAQKLIDAGVYITPGQAVTGPQAGLLAQAMRGIEDSAKSLPIVGDVLKAGQRRSIKEYNEHVMNEALAPLGKKVKSAGINGLDEADQIISDTYDAVKPHISVDPRRAYLNLEQAMQDMSKVPLFDGDHFKKLASWLDRKLEPLSTAGKPVDGETAKLIDAELGDYYRKFRGAGPGNEPLAEGFYKMREAWRGTMVGSTPEAVKTLEQANAAYAKLVPIEKAVEKSTTGIFMPKQLSDALRSTGNAKNDLTQAARQVLPATVPDTGTAGREMLGRVLTPGGMSGTAAAAGVAGLGMPALAAAGALAAYTKPGVKALTQGIHPALSKALRRPVDKDATEAIMREIMTRGVAAQGLQGE